jgi:hypothetical protein
MTSFVAGRLDSIPQYTSARWQLGVDTVYRAVTCGLLLVEDLAGLPDLSSFFHAIRTLSPDDKSGTKLSSGKFTLSGPALWNVTQICGTERLDELVSAYFPPAGEIRHTLNPCLHRGAGGNLRRERRALVGQAPASDHAGGRRRDGGRVKLTFC